MIAVVRVVVVAAVLVGAVAAYRWWSSPERQIHRVLDGISTHLSHDEPATGLAAAAAVAGLQAYFAPDVVVDAGRSFPPVAGRDAVLGAAARLIAGTRAARFDFVDVRITMDGDDAASVDCSVTATLHDAAGRESADARELALAFRRIEGRWIVARAMAVNVLEPVT